MAKKLGIKARSRVKLLGATQDWSIDDLPEGVEVSRRRGANPGDVVIAFFHDRASLERQIESLVHSIAVDGALWIAWPRKAAGHVSNLTDTVVRELALPFGIVDVKVAAIDEDWSGLRFVWRKELRGTLR